MYRHFAKYLNSLTVVAFLAVTPLEAWGNSKGRTASDVTAEVIQPTRSGTALCGNFTECLHKAARTGNLAQVKNLLAEDPNGHIDVADDQQRTALYWAVREDKPHVTKYLLLNNANANVQSMSSRNPKRKSKSALHWTIQNSSSVQLKMLLKHGANPNVAYFSGRTPLHNASKKCLLSHMKTLLEYGADANQRDSKERTALHHARKCGVTEFKVLKEYGASAHKRDEDGETPLHYLVRSTKSKQIVQYLIEDMKAKVNERDDRGRMPIHHAARHNTDIDVVKYLVIETANADKASKFSLDYWSDRSGQTPLHHAARSNKSKEIIGYLADNFLGQLYFNNKNCDPVGRCPDLNHKDYRGRTPLHVAAEDNRVAWDALVLDNRIDLYAEDRDGNTAFMITDRVFRRCKPIFLFISGAGEGDFLTGWGWLEDKSDFHDTVSKPYSDRLHFMVRKFSHSDDDSKKRVQREFKDAIKRDSGYDPIVIIAYSWGGRTAVDWLSSDFVPSWRNLPSVGSNEPHIRYSRNRIILLTLDPVGWTGSTPNGSLAWQATHWINVYSTFSNPDLGECLALKPNCLAKLGGHWQDLPFNRIQNVKTRYDHNRKVDMFRKAHPYLEKEMRKVCGNRFDLPMLPSYWEIGSNSR